MTNSPLEWEVVENAIQLAVFIRRIGYCTLTLAKHRTLLQGLFLCGLVCSLSHARSVDRTQEVSLIEDQRYDLRLSNLEVLAPPSPFPSHSSHVSQRSNAKGYVPCVCQMF